MRATTRHNWRRIIAALALLAVCLAAGAQPGRRPGVLLLVSHQYGLAVPDSFTRGAVGALKDSGMSVDDIYVEYLDLLRNGGAEYRQRLAALLGEKLAGKSIGLIVAQTTPAMQFLEQEGRALFPDVPLFVNHGGDVADWRGKPRQVLLVASLMDVAGTLRQALALRPATRRVLVLLGRDPDRRVGNEQLVRAQLAPFAARLTLEYTNELIYEDMLRRVASLPPDTLVLHPTYFADRSGRTFIPAEVSAKVAALANAPVFVMYDNLVGNGVVGGSVLKSELIGARFGTLAADYLAGRYPLRAPRTVIPVPVVPMYDWRQLRRWGMDADLLPADAVLLNRPPTIWRQYKEYVVGASLVFLLLLALVLLLLRQNRLRKLAQQSIRSLNSELEARVKARTLDLEQAMEQLRQFQRELVQAEKLAALGALVAGVAHELNTPLGNCVLAVTTQSEHQQQFEAALPDGLTRSALERYVRQSASTLQIVERNLARAAALVTSFKQIAVDRSTAQRRRFALATVCAETVLTIGPRLQAQQHSIVCEVADDIVLDSHPGPLGQILSNLIENAVVHGFGERRHGRIHLAASAANGWVRIVVSDDGAGIAPELLGRIFDPFFTTRMGSGGTGLGLHIVHNLLVGLLGGRIAVASTPGQGSSFTLDLPARAPAAD